MRLEILGGVLLGGHFLNTMITREDMDEIHLSGTKVPKKAQLLKKYKDDALSRIYRNSIGRDARYIMFVLFGNIILLKIQKS